MNGRIGGGHLVSNQSMVIRRGKVTYNFVPGQPIEVAPSDYDDLIALPDVRSAVASTSKAESSIDSGDRCLAACTIKPVVSVIMPSYNYGKYILEAITSVRVQSFKNWELVIVDSGSTDNSVDIARESALQDHRITVVQLSVNKGVGYARNVGIHVASGDLICFLDTDDAFVIDRLHNQVSKFLEDETLDFIYGDAKTFDMQAHAMMNSGAPDYELMHKRDYIPACSVMMKTSVAYKVGLYDSRIPAAEDWDFYLRVVASGAKCKHFPGITYKYRVHNESKTLRDSQYINNPKWMDNIRNRGSVVRGGLAERGATNVLYVMPDAGTGGAGIATVDLISRLDRRKYNPFVYIMSSHAGVTVADMLKKMGVPCVVQKEQYKHVPVTGNPPDVNRIKQYMQENNIGLLHNIVIIAARVAAKELGIPIVQMRHQIDYSMDIEKEESHVVICDAALRKCPLFDNSYLVYNGIDTVRFARDLSSGGEFRELYDIPLDAKVVLWAGRLHEDKGPDLMYQVMGNLPSDIYGVVIPVGSCARYTACINDLYTRDNIRVIPSVNRSALVAMYSGSNIVLNTSRTEGNGLVLMEGMACGCTPLAFPVGGIPEIVTNNYNGLLVETPEEMVGTISMLSNGKINTLGDAARRTVVRRFSLLDMVSRFETIYSETLARYGK